MKDNGGKQFLQIRIAGKAIDSGKIPVNLLLRLLQHFNKALHRCGMVLQGKADSICRGPRQRGISDELALDIVKITHGSPVTVLGFERTRKQQTFEQMDLGFQIFEKALDGLRVIQQHGDTLPAGYDAGVLLAWRDAGVLFEKGVSDITFSLNHRPNPLMVSYNETGYRIIQQKIQGPQINMRTIEGRLLMADFKEHGTRCRVHPSIGEPVLCLFDEAQKDEVLENILRYVTVIGEAKEEPTTGKITSIKIYDIQCLEEKEEEGMELLPQGTPIPHDFWKPQTIEELAESQGVKVLSDTSVLFDTWPDDENDGFEEAIRKIRISSLAGIANYGSA